MSLFNLECNGIYAWNICQTPLQCDISVDMSVAGLENWSFKLDFPLGLLVVEIALYTPTLGKF